METKSESPPKKMDQRDPNKILSFQRAYYAIVRDMDHSTPHTRLPNGQEVGQFATDHVFMFYRKKKSANAKQAKTKRFKTAWKKIIN